MKTIINDRHMMFNVDPIQKEIWDLNNVSLILFEHHYDSMLIKKYKFSDINNYLVNNNFKQIYKIKMPFRKTFEYIYLNKK